MNQYVNLNSEFWYNSDKSTCPPSSPRNEIQTYWLIFFLQNQIRRDDVLDPSPSTQHVSLVVSIIYSPISPLYLIVLSCRVRSVWQSRVSFIKLYQTLQYHQILIHNENFMDKRKEQWFVEKQLIDRGWGWERRQNSWNLISVSRLGKLNVWQKRRRNNEIEWLLSFLRTSFIWLNLNLLLVTFSAPIIVDIK